LSAEPPPDRDGRIIARSGKIGSVVDPDFIAIVRRMVARR